MAVGRVTPKLNFLPARKKSGFEQSKEAVGVGRGYLRNEMSCYVPNCGRQLGIMALCVVAVIYLRPSNLHH